VPVALLEFTHACFVVVVVVFSCYKELVVVKVKPCLY